MSNSAISTSPKQPQLGDFCPAYFEHVLAEYELLPSEGSIPAKIQGIIEEYEAGAPPNWGDLYLLEKYVICKQPEAVVRARLPGLRFSYREIVGQEAYEQYLQSGQAASVASGVDGVRADAGRLLDALHWAYAMAPEREQTRTRILKSIAMELSISAVIGAAILLYALYLGQTLVATIVLVTFMGALGGFLSVQQRIAKIPTDQDPILIMFQLQNGRFAVRLAPFTGAVFALILFLLFQADLLKGALFPDMTKLIFWLGQSRPLNLGFIISEKAVEFAKLLVWCFIAGFAERFVPDTLNSLVSKQGEAAAGKASSIVALSAVARLAGTSQQQQRATTVPAPGGGNQQQQQIATGVPGLVGTSKEEVEVTSVPLPKEPEKPAA